MVLLTPREISVSVRVNCRPVFPTFFTTYVLVSRVWQQSQLKLSDCYKVLKFFKRMPVNVSPDT